MAAYGNLQPVICKNAGQHQVSELLGIDRRRVAELRQQLKDTRDPRAQHPQGQDFIRRVSDIFEHDPSRSIRDVAKELDVSHVTLLACVNGNVRCHSYKLKVGQLLTQKNKNMRPPSSPNSTPMDYFSGATLSDTQTDWLTTPKAVLINSIMKQARKLDRALVAKAYSSFRARIQRVIDAEGGWIK
ncbi:Uncharacterized protein FKW44_014557 [Caligus rogercresseyi]|uniref:Uncharacterized protein n=1 Tax=Caligus rogercresseyi TaxID=217165 RepID=A0A7T8K0I3_CALRO|nr:Uncharacterized protein FKW44_014557 [Caligus rogercresseyi]